jgi:hypothetical protein
MDLFHVIDDAAVILRGRNGVYRQAKVYRRGEQLFANHAGGFIRLSSNSGTSCPNVSWLDLDTGKTLKLDCLGAPIWPVQK